MIQKINEPVSVWIKFDHKLLKIIPEKVRWRQREYEVTQLGLHHHYRTGRTLYHVFSVMAENLFMRLVLNTDNLFWRLEEITDGSTN